MKVFLLGATGRLGIEILKELVHERIDTTILVRDAHKVQLKADGLAIFEGTPMNKEDLDQAMSGCDTIVTTLNISRKSDFPWSRLRTPKTLLSDTMTHLLELSSKHGVKKLITVSAWGVKESRQELPFWFRWTIDFSNIKYGYLDHERQENILMKSNLDWMIVRPVGLTTSQKDRSANVSTSPKPSGLLVSRKTVARFMVDQLDKDKFRNAIVTVS